MKATGNSGSVRFSMNREDVKNFCIELGKSYQFDLQGEVEKQKLPKIKE